MLKNVILRNPFLNKGFLLFKAENTETRTLENPCSESSV